MASTAQLLVLYTGTCVALSSVSVTFEWAARVATPEGPWVWYREIGVRNGILVIARHEPPGGGWIFGAHWPQFVPEPLYAGAGPVSGGLYVAVWFVTIGLLFAHVVLRTWQRSNAKPT